MASVKETRLHHRRRRRRGLRVRLRPGGLFASLGPVRHNQVREPSAQEGGGAVQAGQGASPRQRFQPITALGARTAALTCCQLRLQVAKASRASCDVSVSARGGGEKKKRKEKSFAHADFARS